MDAKNELQEQCTALGLSPQLPDQLMVYLELLERWGTRINLTANPDPRVVARTLLPDTLALARMIASSPPDSILDVGSGGGIVGIPLGLCFPQASLTLVEPRSRRCSFLRTAVHALGRQATVAEGRLEGLSLEPHQLVCSRATWSPESWLELATGLLAPGAQAVVFLGAQAQTPSAPSLTLRELDYQLPDGTPRRLALYQRAELGNNPGRCFT